MPRQRVYTPVQINRRTFINRLLAQGYRTAGLQKGMSVFVKYSTEYHLDDIGFFLFEDGVRTMGRSWDLAAQQRVI